MPKITYQIELLEPVIISDNTGDQNLTATREYIPASVVIGTLATLISKQHGKSSDGLIRKMFLDGQVSVTHAYKVLSVNGLPVITTPTSLAYELSKRKTTKVYNLLFGESEDGKTKSLGGFSLQTTQGIQKATINKEINFHHERDPKTGTSMDGVIFNYEAIAAGQVFAGSLTGAKDVLEELTSEFPQKFNMHIGRSRTGQYGRVAFSFGEVQADEAPEAEEITKAVLRLSSDMLLYNALGFSETSVQNFQEYLISKDIDIKIVKSFIKSVSIESFNARWGMHTTSEWCYKAGSCFLLTGDAGAFVKLRALIAVGLGERTHEGFGKAILETDQQSYYLLESDDFKTQKPENSPSPEIRKLLLEIFTEFLLESSRNAAIVDLTKLKNKQALSPSLLSRLLSFAVASNSMAVFSGMMKKLRSKATLTLNKAYLSNDDLSHELMQKRITINSLLKNDSENYNTLLSTLAVTTAEKIEIEEKLTLNYLRTFFSHLRKQVQVNHGEQK